MNWTKQKMKGGAESKLTFFFSIKASYHTCSWLGIGRTEGARQLSEQFLKWLMQHVVFVVGVVLLLYVIFVIWHQGHLVLCDPLPQKGYQVAEGPIRATG